MCVSLLVRGARPRELIEAGRFFCGHTVQLLAQGAEVISITRRIGKAERTFALVFVGFTVLGFLPKVVRHFNAGYPASDVTLQEMTTTMERIVAIEQGAIDRHRLHPA